MSKRAIVLAVAVAAIGLACAITPEQNFLPVSFTVSSGPYNIIATPITPAAPYSQAAYQCNVTGDSRYPPFASGTFPLTLSVPVGQRVRVIFANGNLNGATVTQQGEPGVIVQQGGAVIVQQAGGASPIVQNVGSPIVQQKVSSPAVTVVQQSPTVVQQPSYTPAPTIPPLPPQPPTPTPTPVTPTPTPKPETSPPPPTPASSPPPPTPASSPPPPTSPPPPAPKMESPPPPAPKMESPPPPAPKVESPPPPAPKVESPPPPPAPKDDKTPPTPDKDDKTPPPSPKPTDAAAGRKLLQDRVPGGPNNGLVEYVALASANSVPGFYAGSTQFGVPYVEFTASEAARGQTASFMGALVVAQVVGGVPVYPFTPNPSLSPYCQVNVNFNVA